MLRAELPRAGIGAEAVALRGNDLVKFSVALARSRSNDALLVCVILRGAAQARQQRGEVDGSIMGHSPFYGNEVVPHHRHHPLWSSLSKSLTD